MKAYRKKAKKVAHSEETQIIAVAKELLRDIEKRREEAVLEMASKFDKWSRDIIVSDEELQRRIASIPNKVKADSRFAYDQVYGFALKQRDSMTEFSVELFPGVTLGQRLIPCRCAGCYVPGGRFAHAASAIMSIATAKAAGVPFVVACSPPRDDSGINPYVLYAMSLCKPDVIMTLGGVQAIGAMAYGLFTGRAADIVVGPGNRFVAEAKRLLYGQIGIDVFAGPSESLVIADSSADPYLIAVDLMSQAEHGYDSPVWLLTDSEALGKSVLDYMPKVISDLPNPEVAAASWKDYGEVILCSSSEEMAQVANELAVEHVQVMARDLNWWLSRLNNYGSLFLGESCTVAFGDKTSGTNHILPTQKAAKYSGGLNVGKFVKTVTYQKVDPNACIQIAAVTSRISRLEGMEGHARAADVRLRKYFPNRVFDFPLYEPKNR